MKRDQSLAAKLHNIENGISGVQNNPEIQERMSQYSYTPERVAFHRETGKLQDFRATGECHRSLSGWLSDARILYINLQQTPGALETMALYGSTTERLQEEQQQVEEIAQLHSKQLEEIGSAQQSTKDRDHAFDDLCDWYSDFRAIARVALYDKPQLLEALGIVKK
jgi:hypothetical protein